VGHTFWWREGPVLLRQTSWWHKRGGLVRWTSSGGVSHHDSSDSREKQTSHAHLDPANE
jgi:hypothetical protein